MQSTKDLYGLTRIGPKVGFAHIWVGKLSPYLSLPDDLPCFSPTDYLYLRLRVRLPHVHD